VRETRARCDAPTASTVVQHCTLRTNPQQSVCLWAADRRAVPGQGAASYISITRAGGQPAQRVRRYGSSTPNEPNT
jgi:hypothetical protein